MRRICIVTSGNVGSNPRVVKEADALVEAGFDVRVVATDLVPWVRERDRSVLESAKWHVQLVGSGSAPQYTWRRAQRKLATGLIKLGVNWLSLSVAAQSAIVHNLTRAASSEPAHLYIGHYTAALPAVSAAAHRHGTRFAFDAEDYHAGQYTSDNAQLRSTLAIENRLLANCAYISAASPGIAAAYQNMYKVEKPHVILNVFPLINGPLSSTPKGTINPSPSIYWFSQVVGPNRGLETVVKALGHMQCKAHLYLRGEIFNNYGHDLSKLARQCGVVDRVHFLKPALPSDMERLASCFDVGLVSEDCSSENRRIALTNKLFSYLLAGLPIVASSIPAHVEISSELGSVLSLFEANRFDQLAAAVDWLLLNPHRLSKARQDAWALGQNRFNWDLEKAKFVKVVEDAMKKS